MDFATEKNPQESDGELTLSHETESLDKEIAGWSMKDKVEAFHDRDLQSGFPPQQLGITWRNLTIEAVRADATVHENVVSQFYIGKHIMESRHKPPLRKILDNSHGCVKPGEMLLVLGRPGAGCTTLMSVLANRRRGYASVSGDVWYGSMDAEEAKKYKGQVVINTEDELHFPTLTVGQTMDFATRLKVSARRPDGLSPTDLQVEARDFLLQSMGIEHTYDTKVGNEYVRGVSGGERKRVSIIETLATRGSVYCWDNSTRGLDASTALEYTKAIRALTDVLGLSSIVSLYQAGNGIYNLFDKVLVLDEGKEVFYGPLKTARPFMEKLGFICSDGANVADFLTGVTVPTERRIRPECEKTFPRNADTLKTEYETSPIYTQMTAEYGYPQSDEAREQTRLFQEGVAGEKDKSLRKSDPFTVSLATQVKSCIIRQYQILWGSKATMAVKQIATVAQALIGGSMFYNAPNNTAGIFIKGGALFLSLLHNALMSMSEVTDSYSGRPVLLKQKYFAFYHPAAFCIAQIAADIPVILVQVTVFAIPLYFMTGLTMTASAFFTYWILLIAATMCMTAFFRAVGAGFRTFDAASKIAGTTVMALLMYTGFIIQRPKMHVWFSWIFWINPLAYTYDALMSNELHGKTLPCVGTSIIPSGPGYNDPAHQSCAGVPGALPGATSVNGDAYLSYLSYSYSHVWRNFGILWAWWALFAFCTVFFTSRWRFASEGGAALCIPREKAKTVKVLKSDEEAQEEQQGNESSKGETPEKSESGQYTDADLIRNTSVFTWKNLCYTVKTPSGDRQLLDNVYGWVKPGMLGALMGASGAGKTTLLDVLAQRKTEGVIRGSIMVDGRPLPVSFQRSAGYCEQLDVHEGYATVREALEFSALLRQSRDTPREEKLRYVDTIIDLLELNDLADTLIGQVGAGLSVEQRKRVTIGVELVSKPSILIFLDEPTSGLDGQSAYNTVRFLRKLADVGQAVLVTIHQPSAQLFAQFDTLLLLAKGGKMVYFGDIGENGQTVKDYFGRNGAPCPKDANPAEYMIDVVSGSLSQGRNWNEVWMQSPEHAAAFAELDRTIDEAAAKPPATLDDGHEFALPLWDQIKIVSQRMNVTLYRNTGYINNKFQLHVLCGLLNGFSFWKIGSSISDLQTRLFTTFLFIFVATGVIHQLQPLFMERRDIYEARESKSKMYSWKAFVTGLIVSELPYLCICAVIYFACWYFTVGFPSSSSRSGATFFIMLMYEFVYTGIGQFVAAYAPNPTFASLINPFVIGILINFCGVMVPYAQITEFWRYWVYWMNPYSYLMGGMLVFNSWGASVKCTKKEFAYFDPPNGTTCGQYLEHYLLTNGASNNLVNPEATSACQVCQYKSGTDYLKTLNITHYYYGWRDAGIVVLFVISGYAMVYGLMKLRTKTSKKAE